MKRANLYALLLGAGFVFLLAASSRSAPLPRQRATFAQQQVAPMHASTLADDEEQQEETFTGTISKSEDKFVLVGEDSTYNLDDQDKAKAFEGKKVKVTGKLDKDSNTIHVSDIVEVQDDDSGQG
jgi:lipopolysaccharide export system protein LptA